MLMAIETVGCEFGVDSRCDDAANGLAGAHATRLCHVGGCGAPLADARLSNLIGSRSC
jgi:hypothetical protein